MARHPKPTAELKLNGTFEHNKGRYAGRANEPQPEGEIGDFEAVHVAEDAFERVSDAFQSIKSAAPAGVLKSSDRIYVGIAARMLAEFYAGTLSDGRLNLLERMLSKLGLNPTDRTRIGVSKQERKEVDEFAELAAEVRTAKRPN